MILLITNYYFKIFYF